MEELYESEHVCNATKHFPVMLDFKYEKADLHEVMETRCQHLRNTQCNDLLKLLQKFEELFDVRLGAWKTYPGDFELKEYANTICLLPYQLPKVYEEILKNEIERLVLLGALSRWQIIQNEYPHPLVNLNLNQICCVF